MLAAAFQSFKEAAGRSRSSETGTEQMKHEREHFNRHLNRDAGEVVSKLCQNMNTELKQVVEEMVSQANEFWSHQLHRTEEMHKEEVTALKGELMEAAKQLDETVKMYNQVVQNLNTQLAEAHENADVVRKMAETKAAAVMQQSSDNDAAKEVTRQELVKQLAALQAEKQDTELKAQQKRLVLVQTVDKQHKEIEELKKELKKAEARDAKLTSVSEHLLAKQATYITTIKALQEQLQQQQQPGVVPASAAAAPAAQQQQQSGAGGAAGSSVAHSTGAGSGTGAEAGGKTGVEPVLATVADPSSSVPELATAGQQATASSGEGQAATGKVPALL